MKARHIALFLVLFFSLRVSAQPVKVIYSDGGRLGVSLGSGELLVSRQQLCGLDFTRLRMEGFGPSAREGMPCLPTMVKMLEVPLCKGFDIKIKHIEADTVPLESPYVVAPLQPSRSKSDTSRPMLVQDVAAYATDEFMGCEPVRVEPVGVARSQNLARLLFSPVRYNAVRGQLIVVRNIEVEITYREPDAEATRRMAQHRSAMFAEVPVVNADKRDGAKDAPTTSPVRYLIVAHSSFRDQLDSFVVWKRRKGFITDIVYTDDAAVGGTAASIAAYVKSQYTYATRTKPAPTFLLLVGDVEQIPAFDGENAPAFESHVTDLYYVTWTDGDLLPDCYCGRFSAQDAEQLLPQIEKTLMYEQCTFADPSFLDRAVMVSGIDAGYSGDNAYDYGDPAMDYAISTYINGSNGYSSVVYYKNNTAQVPSGTNVTVRYNGGNNSDTQAGELRALYNAGAGWINYTAHGGVDEWSMPSFTNEHVAEMSNRQKFGFMIGNCCLSNSYQEPACLGEALLRRGDHCGAVAYLGGSNSTYWSEDFYWSVGVRSDISNTMNASYDAANLGMYDRLVHSHGEPVSQHYTSAGAMMMAGNLAVESSTSSRKEYYWEVYNLMGDPSVTPWLTRPAPGVLVVGSSLVCGSTTLTVTAAPYAYVALTSCVDHSLVAATFANSRGQATLSFGSITAGAYELVATAQNHQPAYATLTATLPNGPYAMVTAVRVNAAEQARVNPELTPSQLPVGDTVHLDIEIANIGAAACDSVVVSLRSDAGVLLPLVAGVVSGSIGAGDTVTLSAAYPAKVWGRQADGAEAIVTAMATFLSSGDTMLSVTNHRFVVAAPRLVRTAVSLSRGSVASGDTVVASLFYRNEGAKSFTSTSVSVQSLTPQVAATGRQRYTFDSGGEQSIQVQVVFDGTLPASLLYPLPIAVSDGDGVGQGGYLFRDTFYIQIGESVIEDFETGDFSRFAWRNSTYPWQITREADDVFSGSFSARSHAFSSFNSSNKSSELSLTWTSQADDSISYWRRVSSEQYYDEFVFAIDNNEQETLSGEVAWGRVAFFVPAGTHTFKFTYSKDWSNSSGSDCVWLDNVKLPAAGTVYRYVADTVCQGEPYLFRGTNVAQGLQPGVYHFVDSSIANVKTWLTLTVAAPVVLTLTPSDTTVDLGQPVTLSASGALAYQWSNGYTVPTLMLYPTGMVNRYTVAGSNGGCSDTRQVTVTVRGATEGVPCEPVVGELLSVYPNPARDRLAVTAGSLKLAVGDVRLYDLQGRSVAVQGHSDGNGLLLSLQGLRRGVYMLQVAAEGRLFVKKIVVY
ncbi:MAG: T9SS type A sorting domain-containing protein [Bacteroidales bacterium]|nr:T9SS type A sorting domain-containing protein [Bacteroidales bacterium]